MGNQSDSLRDNKVKCLKCGKEIEDDINEVFKKTIMYAMGFMYYYTECGAPQLCSEHMKELDAILREE